MSADANVQDQAAEQKKAAPVPNFKLPEVEFRLDSATLIGMTFALALVFGAIVFSDSNATFFNGPAAMIVVLGTLAATSTSFTSKELSRAGKVIGSTLIRRYIDPSDFAMSLIDLAVIARARGILELSKYEKRIAPSADLSRAVTMLVDGAKIESVERMLSNEIESLKERHKRSASITRRAAEVAPAMGLIGTLVGLVQMLADLQNPEAIGPAMAIALLTTFYGAILGTIVMAPLAVKLEKHTADEVLIKSMIKATMTFISSQENPRRLELILNAELPPTKQIKYFD